MAGVSGLLFSCRVVGFAGRVPVWGGGGRGARVRVWEGRQAS